MISSTREEIFIKEFDKAKFYSFAFTKDFFRTQFNKPNLISTLPKIIELSINNKINVVPALAQLAQEFHDKKFNWSAECVGNVCIKLHESIKNISINDEEIVQFCTLKTIHTGIDSSYIKPQLKLATFIKNEALKKSTVKKIFSNLLEINDTARNQELIFNFWKKLKKDSRDIKNLIPLVINDNFGIHQKKQEFYTVEIDCNKIGKDFKEKLIYPFNCSRKIINKFSGLFPNSIIMMKEEKEKGLFLLIMKNEEASAKISICLDYFMHKINQDKSWNMPMKVDEIIDDTNWNSIILAEKLEKNLDDKKTVKKTKI